MRAPLVALTILAAVVARAPSAQACSCAMPAIEVLPRAGDIAPLNTLVRVFFPGTDKAPTADAVFLRARGGAAVEVTRRRLGAGSVVIDELTPVTALLPETHYEIMLAPEGKKPGLIGELVTGKEADSTAPSWRGVSRTSYVKAPAVCCNCSTGDPYAVLSITPASDDATGSRSLLFGVWLAGEPGKATPEGPPLTYVWEWQGVLSLGHQSQCSPPNFQFPAGVDAERLVVRAVDLAGRMSAPSQVVVDLSHPTAKPR